MRGLRARALAIVAVAALAWQPGVADAQAGRPLGGGSVPAATPGQPASDLRPIVVGLGAIAGVVIFNVAVLGVEALPGGLAYGAGATVPAEMSVAMSRVYATTSAVVGGLIAYYAYGH